MRSATTAASASVAQTAAKKKCRPFLPCALSANRRSCRMSNRHRKNVNIEGEIGFQIGDKTTLFIPHLRSYRRLHFDTSTKS
jgi:hypothetical protein